MSMFVDNVHKINYKLIHYVVGPKVDSQVYVGI
jgi:hypothetical protein